ncbi:MAG TPA: hypothetical protein DCM08_09160 [Microscillaceae bacterium]|jgi:hypothetical protein|nr:hypothetical protein [Microscillaceae bacterium]
MKTNYLLTAHKDKQKPVGKHCFGKILLVCAAKSNRNTLLVSTRKTIDVCYWFAKNPFLQNLWADD